MSADPNKKSPRTFQCRDVLWDTFEQMARELECSVDYLVNEAMKQYARQRAAAQAGPPSAALRPMTAPMAAIPAPTPAPLGGFPPPSARLPPPPIPSRAGGLPMPPPRAPAPPAPPQQPTPPPPLQRSAPPPPMAANQAGLPLPPPQRGGYEPPPQRPASMAPPPPPPAAMGRTMASPVGAPPAFRPAAPQQAPQQPYHDPNEYAQQAGTLSAAYLGERFPVNKDRFIIGRGKQSSDLTLKDPNVSRQHAMVEYQNGVYFMVDMGSTNGVEFNGQRITRKQIHEGDTYRICDHEIRFTFR